MSSYDQVAKKQPMAARSWNWHGAFCYLPAVPGYLVFLQSLRQLAADVFSSYGSIYGELRDVVH
jgi:hypothetical protein